MQLIIDTTLEYYLGINPEELSDEMWYAKYQTLAYIRNQENNQKQ